MTKIGVVLDSYSGYTKDELKEYGFEFLPLQININNNNYLEGIEIDKVEVLLKLREKKEAKTSLPPFLYMENLMKELDSKYDKVVILPINSNLSSECGYLQTIAADINKSKFIIFDNNFNGEQYLWMAQRAKSMLENGKSDAEVIKFLKEYNESSLNFIVPASLDPFIKGGRLKGAKKILMTSLKLVPLLKNQDGVTVDGVKKTHKSAVVKVVEKLIEFIGGEKNIQFYDFWILQTGDGQLIDFANETLAKYSVVPVFTRLASSSTMIHAGIDSISIGVSKKL
ncbi:DegV family protein [Mycoplasma sp. 4044]